MDSRRQSLTSRVESAEPALHPNALEPDALLASALSDDEAFEALAASMTLLDPGPRVESTQQVLALPEPLQVDRTETLAATVEERCGELPELRPFEGAKPSPASDEVWLGSSPLADPPPSPPSPAHDGTNGTPPGEMITLGLLTGEYSDDLVVEALNSESADEPADDDGRKSADDNSVEGGPAPAVDVDADRVDGADPAAETWWRPTTLDELATVVDTYLRPVVAVSASLVNREDLLDEVVSKTFMSAWVAGRQGTPSGSMAQWLYSICVETVLRNGRRQHREVPAPQTRYPAPSHRGSEEIRVAEARQLWEISLALGEMSDLERSVLRLSHQGGLLPTEIASETNSSLGAVKSCLYRSSDHLVNRLSHRLDEDVDNPGHAFDDDGQFGEWANDDIRADHTWFLAGVANGSRLSANDRRTIRDVRNHLSVDYVWTEPSPGLGDSIMIAAAHCDTLAGRPAADNGDVVDLSRTTAPFQPQTMTPRPSSHLRRVIHPSSVASVSAAPESKAAGKAEQARKALANVGERARSAGGAQDFPRPGHGKVVALALGVIVSASAIILAPYLLDGGPSNVESPVAASGDQAMLDYELQPTEVDPDARAVVMVSESAGETAYRMWLGGLNATDSQQFYAAWLVDTNTIIDGDFETADAVFLGSFLWTVSGKPIELKAENSQPRFDHLILTLQQPGDAPGPSGAVVLEGLINSPNAER